MTRYFEVHHTPADTADTIRSHEIVAGATAIATMAYVIADMPERLDRHRAARPNR